MNTVFTNIIIILNREENHLIIRVHEIQSIIRLVSYGTMTLFSSTKLETGSRRTIEIIDRCQSNLLVYKILTSTGDENESDCVREESNSKLKGDHIYAARDHMYLTIKMSEQFDFINHLEYT